jgi:hypothetical protein
MGVAVFMHDALRILEKNFEAYTFLLLIEDTHRSDLEKMLLGACLA